MKIITSPKDLISELFCVRNKIVGFVPTMGTLHEGHFSLIEMAKSECDFIVISIFINPTQFNDKSDFDNYPKNLKDDLLKLRKISPHIAFCPEYEELYKHETQRQLNLNGLDKTLDGLTRKGHFNGVIRVVNIFFELIQPNSAYFGEKDYQQYLIIKKLANEFKPKINIVACPTLRESNGLAMSSRNKRLNQIEIKSASKILKTLTYCKENYHFTKIEQLEKLCLKKLSEFSKPEYFKIRSSSNLSQVKDANEKCRAFAATKIGDVRLIDNLALN